MLSNIRHKVLNETLRFDDGVQAMTVSLAYVLTSMGCFVNKSPMTKTLVNGRSRASSALHGVLTGLRRHAMIHCL